MRPGLRLATSYSFQSTLPIQGETKPSHLYTGCTDISIHSPYTGRDISGLLIKSGFSNFNPLSLYRERRNISGDATTFQHISIHSPYTGRDSIFAHKPPNIQPISYAKRQTKELFPTPTQQIITSLALISSISRCESPCIFMCTSHSH